MNDLVSSETSGAGPFRVCLPSQHLPHLYEAQSPDRVRGNGGNLGWGERLTQTQAQRLPCMPCDGPPVQPGGLGSKKRQT